jgi:hypothetical protein
LKSPFDPEKILGLYALDRAEERRASERAAAAGFDVLVTGDRTVEFEQNLTGRRSRLYQAVHTSEMRRA